GQHQVTRLGSLDGNFGRFQIANLTDHDDVRVLAEKSAQGGGEIHAGPEVEVDLIDSRHVDFDRILDRRDIAVFGVEYVECRVEGDRFTAPGRAGDQDHAIRFVDGVEKELFLLLLIAEGVDAQLGAAGVEDA